MTVDEFYAFTDTGPDHEKWELIGGNRSWNESTVDTHGKIVSGNCAAIPRPSGLGRDRRPGRSPGYGA